MKKINPLNASLRKAARERKASMLIARALKLERDAQETSCSNADSVSKDNECRRLRGEAALMRKEATRLFDLTKD